MIWPPKVLTWWLACGGSTSSTLSTRVRSAGTASWYSRHSPGESAKKKNKELESIRFQMVLPPGQVLCYKALSLLPVPSWAVLLLSRSVMISAWMSLILLRSAARLYSICSICVWGITCLSCTCAHTPNVVEPALVKNGLVYIIWLLSLTFPASVRLATKVAKAWQTFHCLAV